MSPIFNLPIINRVVSKASCRSAAGRNQNEQRILVMAASLIFCALLVTPLVAAPAPVAAPGKKLIEYGWDVPTPVQMREELSAMEKRPFDGIIFRLSGGHNAFVTKPLEAAQFAEDEGILRNLPFTRFSDNFVLVWGSPPADFDWFNDTQWGAIEANARLLVGIAQAGRVRGICFDPEPYDFSLWDYAKQPTNNAHTFATWAIPGSNNINGKDPLLVDGAKRNFRLQQGSPAIGAGRDGVTIGALEYPNVYHVDPRHPAAADEPAWGYPAVPLATLARACAIAKPGETILLRGGVYRETLRPQCDGITIRAMKGEKVSISGADVIEGWKREADGTWSASLQSEPTNLLRDGAGLGEFTYDKTARRIVVKGGDPRLHLFETVVREHGIDLGGMKNLKIEGITVTKTLKEAKGPGAGPVRVGAAQNSSGTKTYF